MSNVLEIRLKNFALLLVLLLPLSLFVGPVMIEICMIGVGIVFLVRSFIVHDFNWLKATWVKVALLFCAYLSLRNVFNSGVHSFIIATMYFRFILFAIAIGYWIIKTKEDKDKLYNAILIIAIFISFNTIIQYVFGADLFGNIVDYKNYPRLVTPKGKLIPGMMLAMLLLPVISRLLNNLIVEHNRTIQFLSIAGTLFFTFAIFITGERTPFLIFISGIFLLILCQKKLRKYMIHFTIIFCLLAGSVYLIKPQTLQRQFGQTFNEVSNFSESSYGAAFKMAWKIFKNHPIFGVGINNFRVECQHVQIYGIKGCYLHAHNIYLEVLAESGIIGFALLIALISLGLRDAAFHFVRIRKDPLLLGAMLLVALKLLPFLSGPSINTSWAFAPFWLMLGLYYTSIWQRKEN